MVNYYKMFEEKISNKSLRVGVMGLGYVGLPLAIEFAKAGFEVFGLDVNPDKVSDLNNGHSYIIDIDEKELVQANKWGKFIVSGDFALIAGLDAISICVPTPLTHSQEPDMSYIEAAVEQIVRYMHKGLMIILESTTYPGTTEEYIEERLRKIGFEVGIDYFLCYSPERVDPGNGKYSIKNTPKVLGGTSKDCTYLGVALYSKVVDYVVPVSSPKVAELCKLIENTFRSINIAFINEMAILADKMGINIWETLDAANTKPFGFMKFTPGPGIGGHCIPLDPMYLSWKAKESDFSSRFIELAQEINKSMPNYVYQTITHSLNGQGKPVSGSKILILGMAYKANIDDLRESPGLEIFELVKENGALVEYNDPHSNHFINHDGEVVFSTNIEDYRDLQKYDCIVIITDHQHYDFDKILKNAKLIVDTRNSIKSNEYEHVVKLGSNNMYRKKPITRS